MAICVLLVYCEWDDFFNWNTVNISNILYWNSAKEKLHNKTICYNFTGKKGVSPLVSRTRILFYELLYTVDSLRS